MSFHSRILIVLSLLFAMVALAVGACSRPTEEEPIAIGTILGLTGSNAAYGEKMLSGFELAIEEANANGGIDGRPLKLLVEDSQFDPVKAVSAYRRLRGVEGIGVFVGITGSKNALPVCAAADSDDVVIIDALGSAPKLTTHGGSRYWRVMASDALAGRYNVKWAAESGMRRPAVIHVEDDWGTSYRDAIVAALDEAGFKNVPMVSVEAGSRNFRPQIVRLGELDIDTVFLLVYASEGAGLMQQMREAGIDPAVYGSDNISADEFVNAGPDVIENVRVAMPAPANGERYVRFAERFESRFGIRPDANSAKSYDAMTLAVAVMRDVGPDPAAIRARLSEDGFAFDGVTGRIEFDENGDLVSQEYRRMTYRDGRLVEAEP